MFLKKKPFLAENNLWISDKFNFDSILMQIIVWKAIYADWFMLA